MFKPPAALPRARGAELRSGWFVCGTQGWSFGSGGEDSRFERAAREIPGFAVVP